jgi:outer membrane protein OmpA-like peptidoglycan-associated protein
MPPVAFSRLVLPAAILALSAGSAAADCGAINKDIKAALSAGAVDRYGALFKAMVDEPSCDGGYRDQIGRAMARSTLATLADDSGPDQIRTAAQYGRPWQVLVALGDAYYDRKDWANAVKTYEEALDDMRDQAANPKPPPEDVEKRTYKRAIEARALAPTFVASRQFRGKKSGLADPVFRNFTAEVVPVPVRFETDSDALTPDGKAAVEDIFAYVQSAAPEHVTIIGHTDPRGDEAYNIDLSGRRAATVQQYLAELGYKGKIEVIAKGESEPFAPDDANKYSEDEIFAFDRRVEYKTAD